MTKLLNQLNQYEMNPELTFIAPSIIGLRDAIKKLTVSLEQKPKYPPPEGAYGKPGGYDGAIY